MVRLDRLSSIVVLSDIPCSARALLQLGLQNRKVLCGRVPLYPSTEPGTSVQYGFLRFKPSGKKQPMGYPETSRGSAIRSIYYGWH